jgi:RNA polymerase sigma-70 factor (ECF subfamily)
MFDHDPDAELVRRAQAGDSRAFEAIVVKYQRRIARHVARYLKSADDVEDAVQEVFLRVYRSLNSFRGESLFYTWLFRVATNAALRQLERKPSDVLLGDDDPEERMVGFEPGITDAAQPERTAMAEQIAQAVQTALSKLQPHLAEALMLYEVENKSYAEIAQMLDIPLGTVRTWIYRARESIAKRLQPVLHTQRSERW